MMMYFSSRPPRTILLGRANYLRQLANESVFLFTKIASSANTDAGVLSVLEYTRRLTRNLVWDWTLPPNIANSGRVMVTMASDGDVTKLGIVWSDKKRTIGIRAATGRPSRRVARRGSWRPAPRSCHTRSKPGWQGRARSHGDTSAR